MKLNVDQLVQWFPNYVGDPFRLSFIQEVCFDSRQKCPGSLFIPIIGGRYDAHDFIFSAAENGAVATFWQQDRPIPEKLAKKMVFFLVSDTTQAMQRLAERYLHTVSPYVCAVTGSNGKTTTKDLMASVLATSFRTHQTAGNLNNHLGVPQTILAMPNDTEVLVLEMGMNHFGEISFLSRLAKPHIAVITNIGESHIEFLGSREGIARAKMEITDGLQKDGKIVYDGDEPLLKPLMKKRSIAVGFERHNDIVISQLETAAAGLTFKLDDRGPFTISLIGRHHAKNAAYAATVGRLLGVSDEKIQTGLRRAAITPMRFERHYLKDGTLIINDAYNASPTSMKAALETICQLEDYPLKVAVLGDMLELGPEEKEMHASVAKFVRPPLTHLFTIGAKARWIADAVDRNNSSVKVYSFQKKEACLSELRQLQSSKTVMLFKASRGVGLETVIEALS